LLRVSDAGLIVLAADERLDRINSKAKSLLGLATNGEFEERWPRLRRELAPILKEARDRRAASAELPRVTADWTRPRSLWIEAQHLEGEEGGGYLLFLEEAERAAIIERSLRQAVCHRCLLSLSRDIAHSLKDRLNVVLMYVELMAQSLETSAVDLAGINQAAQSADVARRELLRLDHSHEAILDPNMIERAVPQAFDVKTICESLMLLVAARASRQRVALTSTLDAGAARMLGFPDRMHQALLCLMVNALDAMPDGGTLQVTLTKAESIRILVSDSGPRAHRRRAASERQQRSATSPTAGNLGLAVTQFIVEAHGGTILYEPAAGGGSSFTVELPAHP
jgi:signal transduction histidine kinase